MVFLKARTCIAEEKVKYTQFGIYWLVCWPTVGRGTIPNVFQLGTAAVCNGIRVLV